MTHRDDARTPVMFDMDGLLVDSEPLWLEAETAVMARLGLEPERLGVDEQPVHVEEDGVSPGRRPA